MRYFRLALPLLLLAPAAPAQVPCGTWQGMSSIGYAGEPVVEFEQSPVTQGIFAAQTCWCGWHGSMTPAVLAWNGTYWNYILDPIDFNSGQIYGLEWLDDGTGGALYAFGSWSAWPPLSPIVRWGAGGLTSYPSPPSVTRALVAFDDGTGSTLYAGTDIGVYRLDGTTWRSIGAIQPTGSIHLVSKLVVHDGPSARVLVAAGNFASVGGIPSGSVAAWDGTMWNPLGSGFTGAPAGWAPTVLTLHSVREASGPALYAGGSFASADGTPANGIARYDGASWVGLGAGLPGTDAVITDIETFDDGTGHGPRIVVTGRRGTVSNSTFLRMRDGSSWVPLPALPAGTTQQDGAIGILLFPGLQDPSLVVNQAAAGNAVTARFDACGWTGELYCFGDGIEAPCPCGNESAVGARVGCLSSIGQGGGLRANGAARLSADTLQLAGSGMPDSTALYFQAGTRHAPFAFGDGLKCTNGPFVRLRTIQNTAGNSAFPEPGGPSVSAKGLVSAPGTRHYQVRYRNAAAFCSVETFNYTNGVTIVWGP